MVLTTSTIFPRLLFHPRLPVSIFSSSWSKCFPSADCVPGAGPCVGRMASKSDLVPALMGQSWGQGGGWGGYRKENRELPYSWQVIRCSENVILGKYKKGAFNPCVEVGESFLENVCAISCLCDLCFSLSLSLSLSLCLAEKGEERERGRKTSTGCFPYTLMEIEPATFWCLK